MEKRKKWQLYLILAVVVLTFYNILPTIFFYSKPLKKPISDHEAMQVAEQIAERVNGLEAFTLSWLHAQSKNLGLKPKSISLDQDDPRIAKVVFNKPEDANFFSTILERAGSLIPFVPAQLNPASRSPGQEETTVLVQRKVGVHLDPQTLGDYFKYVPKESKEGEISSEYRELVNDRAIALALSFGGISAPARILTEIEKGTEQPEHVLRLARTIVDYENTFGDQSPIAERYFASFTQVGSKSDLVQKFAGRLDQLGGELSKQIASLKEKQSELQKEERFLPTDQKQRLEVLEGQKSTVEAASAIVRRNTSLFEAGSAPLTRESLSKKLSEASIGDNKVQTIDLGSRNPFVDKIDIDWGKDELSIILHNDVVALREGEALTEAKAIEREKLNQLLFAEIALASRNADESITPAVANFVVTLNKITNSTSLLVLDIGALAEMHEKTLKQLLTSSWQPSSGELSSENYPIFSYDTYRDLEETEQKLGLVIYAPAQESAPKEGFRNSSIYVIARGLGAVAKKYESLPESPEKRAFETQFSSLRDTLRQNGFIGYSGALSGLPKSYAEDYIFELDDFYSYLLAATREEFSAKGSKKFAFLEFTDVEQRILTRNKIETRIHEDLLKWRDEYRQARVRIDSQAKYDVPKPTQNVLWNNFKLSFLKYFRGDERKILKWGLDLSGGKTVRVGLKDQNNQTITNEADLKQAVNELYNRVNRLGLSEVGIRTEGSTIVLDFPGSQGLSGSDLIQASAMSFNVVNETFTAGNPTLSEAVNLFLEEVWNEAVITNRTDPESINEIAWSHLGGSADHPNEFNPLTSHAQLLYENGLRLAGPKAPPRTSAFDDTLSAVTRFRGTDFSEWQGQTYPLLIVFRNYALEGSNLADVQTGYAPQEGNVLNFTVKSATTDHMGEKINPRDNFSAWTSQFSEKNIAGTPLEAPSKGRGWRMAVILNGSVINAPTLNAELRDSARITGNFSDREINKLAANLKAGSLSFTPHILSEENVSPDLGKEQRTQGILAAVLGLILVVAMMCWFYRFSGLVASIAVLFNLLIIWAVLQNLGAALTLPSIAGIILAIGMAVDANVLVFERIREEFSQTGRLPSAVATGYRKAYTAIVDSNLTTIIAAIILLNFDSGPIKGFALTLIIGIVSSMFTALFMTRFFFAGWVQNPKHTALKMVRIFGETKINFLSKAKLAISISAIIIVLGGLFLVKERESLFGMDFTGGYVLTVDLLEEPDTKYRLVAEEALIRGGAAPSDFQVQELNKPNQLRIQLGTSMEQSGKPFYGIASTPAPQNPLFSYQTYPRIVWIVETLETAGLQLNPSSLDELNLYWTEMSGQLSETMRNQALFGLGLALLCILIYITFRFEFKYAISATIGIAHDVLITLGLLAIIHLFYEGMQIDLQVIAALMTIVGYSLNDTIIIFDRIREDSRSMKKVSFNEIVNHALNATLSRTVMTSGTTLCVLVALVLLGGASIFNFALIMTLGVGLGTLSSLYIAAPLLLYFHKKEDGKESASSLS